MWFHWIWIALHWGAFKRTVNKKHQFIREICSEIDELFWKSWWWISYFLFPMIVSYTLMFTMAHYQKTSATTHSQQFHRIQNGSSSIAEEMNSFLVSYNFRMMSRQDKRILLNNKESDKRDLENVLVFARMHLNCRTELYWFIFISRQLFVGHTWDANYLFLSLCSCLYCIQACSFIYALSHCMIECFNILYSRTLKRL